MTWTVLGHLRKEWGERIALQGVAMVPIEFYLSQDARALVERVAAHQGILGGVDRGQPAVGQHFFARPQPERDAAMARVAALASDEGRGHSRCAGQ